MRIDNLPRSSDHDAILVEKRALTDHSTKRRAFKRKRCARVVRIVMHAREITSPAPDLLYIQACFFPVERLFNDKVSSIINVQKFF